MTQAALLRLGLGDVPATPPAGYIYIYPKSDSRLYGKDSSGVEFALGAAAAIDWIIGLSSNGIVAKTGAGAGTTRTIQSGTGIVITNGDGVSGDPVVALATVATAGTYVKVTIDAYGRVIGATTLSPSDLPVYVGDSGTGGTVGAVPAAAAGDAAGGKFLKASGAWEVPPGGTPSGSAGGDLTGSYPNPSLAATAVTAGIYGATDKTLVATVDAKGRLTAMVEHAIAILASQVTDFSTAGGVVADARIALQKAVANGLATLDGSGKIPASQLTLDASEYKGAWDASTNSPTLADGTGNTGDFYRVSVAGTANLGSGAITFGVGDLVCYSGTVWQLIGRADAVTSVNGQLGAVVLGTDQVAEGSTNKYFLTTRAQDATGAALLDSTTIAFTYASHQISAAIKNLSITTGLIADGAVTDAKIAGMAYSKLTGAPSALPPSGSAGGDLTGSYPSPTLATTGVGAGTYTKVTVDAKGRVTSATTLVAADLPTVIGDTGAALGGTAGAVPAPPAGSFLAGDFLRADGTFAPVDQSKPRPDGFSLFSRTVQSSTTKFQDVVISGNYAYVSGGQAAATVSIYNIANPLIPVLCSVIAASGCYRCAVVGNYLYIPSNGGSTFYIYNVANPYAPALAGSVAITGSPGALYNCVVSGGYAFISTQSQGLTVVDVSNPASPTQVYQEGGGVKSFGIAISGSTLYTTNFSAGSAPYAVRALKTWNVAVPTLPVLQNTYTFASTSTKLGNITLAGSLLLVTDLNQSLYYVMDVSTPTAPSLLSTLTPTYGNIGNTPSETAQVKGNFVYIPSSAGANGGAIDVYDITTPASPVKLATTYSGTATGAFGGIALNGGYIYGANYNNSINGSLDVFTQIDVGPIFGTPTSMNHIFKSLTTLRALSVAADGSLAASATTATELGYLSGVSGPIQSQLNGKQPTLPAATSAVDGYLTHTDWTTFNSKQPADAYITALTGDGTASGPGSASFALAATGVTPGTYGDVGLSPNITVDAKGRVTAAGASYRMAKQSYTNESIAIPDNYTWVLPNVRFLGTTNITLVGSARLKII